ncbi:MAG: hypothetical protein J3R72DRAFT_438945 [Linnemannia gamsii]|nr:MAG: hypothetical protein J3R72DRAFT_438945 [Linnemannia gamsii]
MGEHCAHFPPLAKTFLALPSLLPFLSALFFFFSLSAHIPHPSWLFGTPFRLVKQQSPTYEPATSSWPIHRHSLSHSSHPAGSSERTRLFSSSPFVSLLFPFLMFLSRVGAWT